jgi:hypothetical protein
MMGRISVIGHERYDDAGTPEHALYTTSFHVGQETSNLSSFLECERASCRGVRFPPHAIGALIVMAPDAPLSTVLFGWWRERRRALAARKKWQDWRAAERATDSAIGGVPPTAAPKRDDSKYTMADWHRDLENPHGNR